MTGRLKPDKQTIRKALMALGIELSVEAVMSARVVGGSLQIWLQGRQEPVVWSPRGEMAQETRPVPALRETKGD